MRIAEKFQLAIFIALAVLSGCAKPQAAENQPGSPPAKVENAVKEPDLASIKLSPQAEARLGIVTAAVAMERVAQTREFAGEITLPPDCVTSMAAPAAGILAADGAALTIGAFVRKGQPVFRLTPFLSPERDLRLQLERDITAARTRVEAARVRHSRAEQLLLDKAGSEKAVQQAREELDLAENDLKTARERMDRFEKAPIAADVAVTISTPRDGHIQKIFAHPGQTVPSGLPLFEVADLSRIWIRVPVYVGDLPLIDRKQAARVHAINETSGAAYRPARPINAPPTADPVNNTADLYFELANGDGAMRPGQKVGVTLSERAPEQLEESLVVPWSAVAHDINGGAWVYENIAQHQYVRRRVEVRRVVGSLAVLARGPAAGAKIVTAGVAELFGTEFGTGK